MTPLFEAWLFGFGIGGLFGAVVGAAGGVFVGAFVAKSGRK